MRESELCEKFIAAAVKDGWTVYPECKEWDLVLVKAGTQIAVEAKSRANVQSIVQTVKRNRHLRLSGRGYLAKSGPDFKAVLVPKASPEYRRLCAFLKIKVFCLRYCEKWKRDWFEHDRKIIEVPEERFRLDYEKPLWTPPVVPENVQAGVSSPSPLTPWRVKALRMCARLRAGESVTSKTFKEMGISITRWKQGRNPWIVDSGERDGRHYLYTINDPVPADFPDVGWEEERDAIIAADEEE